MRISIVLTLLILLTIALPGKASGQMTVVNGASFHPDQPVAPGSFATIFGDGLCGGTMTGEWIAPGELPTELGGCTVTVDGVPAMLHHVSPGQINFIMPESVGPGNGSVAVAHGGTMMAGEVAVASGAPGMFALGGAGMGHGAMLHGALWRTGPFSTMTGGDPTHVSIFVTGLDLSMKPRVQVGGVDLEVTFFGPAPGFAGLHQINVVLPESMAGIGQVPVIVISGGHVSNVTFMEVLPTDSMMHGIPGWGPGMHVEENTRRGRNASDLAWNQHGANLVVADQNADALRVIAADTGDTVSTIALPEGAMARSLAIGPNGMVAVALPNLDSAAIVDLADATVQTVTGTGSLPTRLAFSGDRLLVSNAASGQVTVIDTASGATIGEIETGFGPHGIAANLDTAVVANMQSGSLTVIDMAGLTGSTIELPAGTRPMEVAMTPDGQHALITAPMSNGVHLLDLSTREVSFIDTGLASVMGPGALAAGASNAYVASPMTASVAVLDLASRAVRTRIPVSPGPRALALDSGGNRLFVLSNSTGAIDVVDTTSNTVTNRFNAVATPSPGGWRLASVTSISPSSAAAGSAPFEITIAGSNLESVNGIEFRLMGPGGMGGPGMGSGGMGPGGAGGMGPGGPGMGSGSGSGGHGDPGISVSQVSAAPDGASVRATVAISADAEPGARRVILQTDRGRVSAPGFAATFNVTE